MFVGGCSRNLCGALLTRRKSSSRSGSRKKRMAERKDSDERLGVCVCVW